jgi:hypothetical protein
MESSWMKLAMEALVMSKQHGAREQKRLAKAKAKREASRRQVARRNSPDPTIRLKGADGWPIVASVVPENLWDMGIGNLVIARKMPDGQLACGVFLVDVYCLGIKNALWTILGQREFRALCRKLEDEEGLEEVTPEHFAKLVYRAADYGQSLGFPPHRDFRHAQRLLAGIDPSQCPDEFEFGQEGRPLYIRGPGETLDEARMIVARLQAQGGDYVLPLKASEAPPELIDRADLSEIDADECSGDNWRLDVPRITRE